MKRYLVISAIAALFAFTACDPNEQPAGDGTLEFVELTVGAESLTVPGALSFHAVIQDKSIKLSTLEVAAALGDGTIIASASIRTEGNRAEVDQSLAVPFAAGMAQGTEIAVSFEAINVEGKSVKQVKRIAITRPSLPGTLYLKLGTDIFPMAQDPSNANVYTTAKGEFPSITKGVISTAEDASTADFIWGKSTTDNIAELCAFSDAAGIIISYPAVLVEQYSFDAVSFEVKALGKVLDISVNGTKLTPDNGLLYANVSFEKNAEIAITGIEKLDNAWNRDFFEKNGSKFKFLRESGNYDVYYSPKYNYLWIAKKDAVAPDCLWVIGHGLTQAPVWHADFERGGWETDPIYRMGYAVPIGGNKYQCSLYLSNKHEWNSFEFEVYSDLEWRKAKGFAGKSLSGFTNGVKLSGAKDGAPGLTSDTGFQPGYYTIVFDNATGDINLTRHTEWTGPVGSGMLINGTELMVGDSYNYANITFTNGEQVTFSGFEASQINRDFFEFEYETGKYFFAGVSGKYLVQYYPKYGYTWISNENQTFPDCIYILGSGKWAAPVYAEDDLWDDVAYNRSAPYFVVAPKVSEGHYKATMSMSVNNYNWRVLLEFYSDLAWGQEGMHLVDVRGPAADRFYIDGEFFRGVDEPGNTFIPGNYQLDIYSDEEGITVMVTLLYEQ